MKIRNEIIRATYEFFNENGFTKIDPPILTASAPEGTSELFHTKYFDEDAFLSQSGQLYMEAVQWLMVVYSHSDQLSELKNLKLDAI